MRAFAALLIAAAASAALLGCGGGSTGPGSEPARYHDLSNGWTAQIPHGWASVELGPTFVRGEPLADPTRLLVRTYRNRTPAAALRALSRSDGIAALEREEDRNSS